MNQWPRLQHVLMNILLSRDTATVICDLSSFNLATTLLLIYNLSTFIGKINVTVNIFIIICALLFLLFRSACYSIPANSHALGVSLTPAGWKLRSHARSCLRTNFSRLIENVSCCRLAGHNFQKYVNSDPCNERKPCVKWINDNTFLTISDFVDKRFLDNFAFGRLRTSSEDFGLLRESSEMIVSFSKIPG